MRNVFLVSMLIICCLGSLHAEVKVIVSNDTYVIPVSELSTTKTNPDILTVENDLIKIVSLPNRGRILSSYTLKTSNSELLYHTYVPDPFLAKNKLHIVEFGGYYLSVPWNTRDRQPYDLNYTILKKENDCAEILFAGRDILKKLDVRILMRVRDKSPVVELEATISNSSAIREVDIVLEDYCIEKNVPDAEFHFPNAMVDYFDEKGGIVGSGNSTMIPLRAIPLNGHVLLSKQGALSRIVTYYPSERLSLIKEVRASGLFDRIRIETRRNEKEDYCIISSGNDRRTLKPSESISFSALIYGKEGLEGE